MTLTWKDALTTVLAGGTGALAYAKYAGWHSWLTGPRLGFIALVAIGIAGCILSSPEIEATPAWTTALSAFGFLALLLILAGLITGHPAIYYALAGDIVILWLLSTIKHAVG